MKRILIWTLLLLASHTTFGQNLVCSKGLEENPSDLYHRVHKRYDENGNPAAIIRINSTVSGLVFYSSFIVGDVTYETGQYILYIAEGAKYLDVRKEGFLPLTIVFSEKSNIKSVKSNTAYIMEVIAASKSEPHDYKQKWRDYNKNSDYVIGGRNKYVAIDVYGVGYPWNINSSMEFRYGEIIGMGLYCELGLGFTKEPMEYKVSYYSFGGVGKDNDDIRCYFLYSGGIKFFLYKGVFVGCGYGSYMPLVIRDSSRDKYSNVYHRIEKINNVGWTYYEDYYERNHGMRFLFGYDYVPKFKDSSKIAIHFGIKGGIIYDIVNDVVLPTLDVKIGVALDY